MIKFVGKLIVQDLVLFVRSLMIWSIHGFISLIIYITYLMHVEMKICILYGNFLLKLLSRYVIMFTVVVLKSVCVTLGED